MQRQLRYIGFTLIANLLIINALYAAPSITAISGTISNGQNIMITGLNFGSTGPILSCMMISSLV